jgi:DNA modification methylase
MKNIVDFSQRHITFGSPVAEAEPQTQAFEIAFANATDSPEFQGVVAESLRRGSQPKTSVPCEDGICAGKNTYAYDAHTYHTKVPPQGIEAVLQHYTNPGDLVLDPFCGSGMTGLAAIATGRNVVLSDLAPAAVFIAQNFITPLHPTDFMRAVDELLEEFKEEAIALYGTECRKCGRIVPQEYTVWSYGLTCRKCACEFVLWDVARVIGATVRESKINNEVVCPHCQHTTLKRGLKRTKLYPVEVGYKCCGSRQKEETARPSERDQQTLRAIEDEGIPGDLWYPTARLPEGVNTRQAINHGLDSVDKLYTTRNLRAFAQLWNRSLTWSDSSVRSKLLFTLTSLYQRVTKLSEFRFWGGSGNIANYNVPMVMNEQNVFKTFRRKAKTIADHMGTFVPTGRAHLRVGSATDLRFLPDASIDYVFTDPPFGANINYSEMNFLWESWLGQFTDTKAEAIVNRVQGKELHHYQDLLTDSLREIRRVLKQSHWMSIMFHNSSAKVWQVIQNAISNAGFRVEACQLFDKEHGTFKQFVSDNAVGYDLVMHCRATPVLQHYEEKSSPQGSLADFLNRRGNNEILGMSHKFLHVNREDELDYRKLYSQWLKESVERGHRVDCGFEQFRGLVDEFLKSTDQPNR